MERFRVLITDFLDETTVETPVLGDLADLVTAGAWDESELTDEVGRADAMIVYHDIPALTEATFARAGRCRGAWFGRAWGTTTSTCVRLAAGGSWSATCPITARKK